MTASRINKDTIEPGTMSSPMRSHCHVGSSSYNTLAGALSESNSARMNGIDASASILGNEWWAQKKRKRAISCGRCEACCRDDCGKCLNCLDKPKFGGQGVRKQSCLSRKCLYSASAAAAAGPSTWTPHAVSEAIQTHSANMPVNEWRDFWGAVQCCMRLADDNGQMNSGASADERAMSSLKRAKPTQPRQARCGTCAGCTRGDCGECKNCKDKPKYGGKGIKKQACLQRNCLAADVEEDDTLPHSAACSVSAASEVTTRVSLHENGFFSKDSSPALRPFNAESQIYSHADKEELESLALPTASAAVKLGSSRLSTSWPAFPGQGQMIKTQAFSTEPLSSEAATAYSTADEEDRHERRHVDDDSRRDDHGDSGDERDTECDTERDTGISHALLLASQHRAAVSLLEAAVRSCRDDTDNSPRAACTNSPFSNLLGAVDALPRLATA